MASIDRKPAECPHCGGAERLGVWLTRKQRVIFDRIARAGDSGVALDCVAVVAGGGKKLVATHVNQINDKFAGTDWRIKCGQGRSFYRLVNVARPRP